jgi:hypothetical protein
MTVKTENNQRLDLLNLKEGIYFNEVNFGQIHAMTASKSPFGDVQYGYVGRIHKGEIQFLTGSKLNTCIPMKGNWDYGFTLEGLAAHTFEAKDALVKVNAEEKRKFVYINDKSKLIFNGDPKLTYRLYIRIFDTNLVGQTNYRWITLYLEENR